MSHLPPPAELLRNLVRLPSLNPMGRVDPDPALFLERRVTDHLEALLRGLGVHYHRQTVAPGRDNLVAWYLPHGAERVILFEVHQDTVPVEGMTVDPIGGEVRDGRLFGRGACDVKGGMAAMLTAFGRLVAAKPAGAAGVVLAFTVDEEHTFLGVQELVKGALPARPDFAIVAEPTRLNIVHAHKGVVRWHLRTAGRSCHSSAPEQGTNAVYRMGRLLPAVEEYAARLAAGPADPLLGPPTLSLGRILGGTSVNTVPDFCTAEIDRRLVSREVPADAPGHFAEALAAAVPGVPFEVSPPWLHCPALAPEGSEEAVRRLGAAIDAVTGSHRVHAVPFGTDASTLAGAGIPSVVFGPGDIAQAHTRDEWIELREVEQAAEILWRLAVG
jgi:acetylornithine deacetylase